MEMEHRLYDHCAELGITVISVGHRESLKKYHDLELNLKNDGSWDITTIVPTAHNLV